MADVGPVCAEDPTGIVNQARFLGVMPPRP